MASTYLSRTFSSGTTKKWTFSAWIKRSNISSAQTLFYASPSANSNFESIGFTSSGDFDWEHYEYTSSSYKGRLKTNRLFRDVSAWTHIVCVFDSANATAGNRMRLYVNGTEETSFATDTNPTQNQDAIINGANPHTVGSFGTGQYFDGLMAHVHFTDGYAYDASTFGESDSTSGIWVAKSSPSVTYGTNGFFLKFENSGNMDLDSSGNNLLFTTSGTLTQNVDTPDNNFATLNPLAGNCTFSNGNNTWVGTTSGYEHSSATLGVSSGKWYWEVKPTHACGAMGITDFNWQFERRGSIIYASSGYAWVYEGNGYVSHDSYGDIASNYSSYGSSDIIGVALDLDNNKLYFHKNGTYENSGNPTSGSTGTGAISIDAPSSLPSGFYSPLVADLCSATAGGGSVNFGSGYFGTTAISSAGSNGNGALFEYDVPSGYYALNTKNIKDYG